MTEYQFIILKQDQFLKPKLEGAKCYKSTSGRNVLHDTSNGNGRTLTEFAVSILYNISNNCGRRLIKFAVSIIHKIQFYQWTKTMLFILNNVGFHLSTSFNAIDHLLLCKRHNNLVTNRSMKLEQSLEEDSERSLNQSKLEEADYRNHGFQRSLRLYLQEYM